MSEAESEVANCICHLVLVSVHPKDHVIRETLSEMVFKTMLNVIFTTTLQFT